MVSRNGFSPQREERRVSGLSPPEVFLNVRIDHSYAQRKAEGGHGGRGERNINNWKWVDRIAADFHLLRYLVADSTIFLFFGGGKGEEEF